MRWTAKPYNTEDTDVTWETCTLRTWLNGTFLNSAFNADERSRIQTTKVTADKNPAYDTPPGNDTNDKVLLLSIPEAKKYFATDTARRCAPTAYAKAQGAWIYGGFTTADGEDTCWFWLRSPGYPQIQAAYVYSDGSVDNNGNFASAKDGAVRPAMWINLES